MVQVNLTPQGRKPEAVNLLRAHTRHVMDMINHPYVHPERVVYQAELAAHYGRKVLGQG